MPAPVLALVGPTASGKTELALRLARERNGEIISVDSRQIYKGLTIGTAAPASTQGIPYHLVNFLDPREAFSAVQFAARAQALLADIQSRSKWPLLVGGTGFYFRALEGGLAPLPAADPALRARLKQDADTCGRLALHARLTAVDPEAAARIPANNLHRVIRALEVFELTGKPISKWQQEHRSLPSPGIRPPSPFGGGTTSSRPSPSSAKATEGKPAEALAEAGEGTIQLRYIGLDPGQEELDRRIERRARQMLEEGMIEETQAALASGVPASAPGLSALGYPRVIAYLKGHITREELLRLLILDTRQYAKRQRTWFRHQATVLWNPSSPLD